MLSRKKELPTVNFINLFGPFFDVGTKKISADSTYKRTKT